jgi:membrane protease YdiL (CAAX protease family)
MIEGEQPPILGAELDLAKEEARVARWRWALALFLLAFYVLGMGLLGAKKEAVVGTVATEKAATLLPPTIEGLLRLAGGEMLLFGTLFLVAAFLAKLSPRDLYFAWRGGLKPIWRGFGWSLFLRGVIAVVMGLVAVGVAGTSSDPKGSMDALRPKTEVVVNAGALADDPVYLFLAMTLISFVVAGFREELWRAGVMVTLRGLFPKTFTTRRGQVRAVMIAAIIFGLGHLPQGWSGAFVTMVLGMGLGLIIVRYQSIWEAVLAHGFFNASTFLALYWIAKHHPGLLPQ